MATLELKGVGKSFGKTRVIDDLDLFVEEGELIVFVGPSGCGKSTLLRMIAVFQSYALYPHKNVRGNLGFALRHAKVDRSQIDRRVNAAAEILGLTELMDRRPRELSGGQRQRVAIGRAIVREPDVFLFDEPLSNLDAALRVHMRVEILKLHQRLSNTMVYVTHDQVEAMTLADRIVVLRDGHIEQVGTPMELYRKPANVFVAGFIGSPAMNFLTASAHDGKIELAGQMLNNTTSAAGAVTLGLRPEHLQLSETCKADIALSGHVQVFEHLGGESFVHVELDDKQLLVAKLDGEHEFTPGQPISLSVDSDKYHVFGEDEQRLD